MTALDETHDPKRKSWVTSAEGHPDFPIQNLPLGIFSPPNGEPRGGVAIGDAILDLGAATAAGLFSGAARLAADAAAACGEIRLACSKSTATYHFRVLREAGVITQHYQGTAKVNELRRDDLDVVFPGLLDALLASAAAQAGRTSKT